MNVKTLLMLLAVSMLVTGTTAPALAVSPQAYGTDDEISVAMPDLDNGQAYVPGEILVKFSPGMSEAKISALNSKHGTSVAYTSPYAGFRKLNIPKTKSVEEMVEIYSRNPNVEYATPNYLMHASTVPNDPYYAYQWNFHSGHGINLTHAWNISAGQGVIVAVLDTGIAYENYGTYALAPDLAGTSFKAGWDFVNNDPHANDDQGHGTHVAGTIAQSTNNGIGVAGVAYGCTLMPVKVLNKRGSGTLQYLIDGITYAADNDADVISMSLSFAPGVNPEGLENAINYAYGQGVTIVAAAGNDGLGTVCYPAAYDKCIAVGATRYDGDRTSYSNYGEALDIMAPGGDTAIDQNGDGYVDGILQQTFSVRPTNFGYYFYQGTSMATPHVAGVAALLIANGATGPDNVRAAIQDTARDIYGKGWDAGSGHGIVDAYAALTYATTVQPPVNQAPTARMTINPSSAYAGENITFDASGSTDSDGDISSYSWAFGDGYTGNGATAQHAYSAAGTYNVTLTVTDNSGDTGIATGTVSISEIPVSQAIDVAVSVVTETRSAGKNLFVSGKATVNVKSNGEAVQGAVVNGHWSIATSDIDTATTGADGTATVLSDSVKYKTGTLTFTFTVDSVTINGTKYTVSKSGTVDYP
ncbi:S8 family serine peptidase [Methanolobus chelungpuianus]|uniref:S8 family serine peptidase n=1 Tax=Methanolobus chelungpuianus TaxID=502115 RepID=UPI00211495DD|nr:S8 family serine peptidase [Methanolobus chelungpuianus]